MFVLVCVCVCVFFLHTHAQVIAQAYLTENFQLVVPIIHWQDEERGREQTSGKKVKESPFID